MKAIRVYISGPYSVGDREANIARAREAMVELLKMGVCPFCPHTMTANLDEVPGLTYDMFMTSDIVWLDACDCVLELPGRELSIGMRIEHSYAEAKGLPIYSSLEQVKQLMEE